MRSTVEFYDGPDGKMITSAQSPMVPPKGSFVNIRGKTWEVTGVTYAVDHSDDWSQTTMRANVNLRRPK